MVTGKLPIYNPDLMGFFDDLESKPIEYPSFLSESLVYPLSPIVISLTERTF